MSLPIQVTVYYRYMATSARRNLCSTRRFTKSPPCLISGMNPPRCTSRAEHQGKTYLLRYDQEADEWTLQSGFDGDELFARPSIELVTVDPAMALQAQQQIESCEHCHRGDADIPFDWLLAKVTGKHGAYEFVLSEQARCPNCMHEITEKTAGGTEG
jgi:hypothetical protein